MRDGSKELQNLKNDIDETKKLATQYPDKVKNLSSLLSQQLRTWKSPIPIIKNTGKPVAMPDEILQLLTHWQKSVCKTVKVL